MKSPNERLPATITAIRKRLGATKVVFAEMIGVTQPSVTRYESGKTLPGYITLTLLLDLASGAQRLPILEALRDVLGMEKTPTEKQVHQALEAIRKATQEAYADDAVLSPSIELRSRFLHTATHLLDEGDPDETLVRFVEMWDKYHHDPRISSLLADAVGYIEISAFSLTTQQRPTGLTPDVHTTDPEELEILEDMLAVYLSGDPIVADIRRAAAVLRKHERRAPMPKVAARRNR